MTPSFKTLSTYIPATFLFACLAACGASRPQKSETTAPTPSTEEESSASDSVLSAPTDRVAAPGANNEGAAEMESAPEESADLDESDPSEFGEASPAAPAESDPKQEKKSRAPLHELELQVLDFNESLKAEALSCDGARPQKDAICSIAERICEMEGPGTTRNSDCSRAQESCEKAKKQFQKKCG